MTEHGPGCAFCRIVLNLDDEVREVYRDETVVAFFPDAPATLGHTLIIPTKHVADIWAIDQATTERLAVATVHVAAAVRRAVDPHGLNVIQSNGAAASQTVPHVHVHVVPRWTNDAIGDLWPTTTDLTETRIHEILERLRFECDTEFRP